MREHQDATRRALLDALRACEAHGAPQLELDVDLLARSLARQPSRSSGARVFDADAIEFVESVFAEPVAALESRRDWRWSDALTLVPLVQVAYLSYRDCRYEFRDIASLWVERARARLAGDVDALAERRIATAMRAMSRINALARLQAAVTQLDLELVSRCVGVRGILRLTCIHCK